MKLKDIKLNDRFFHIFYSIGAVFIIIGVLAKLTHWSQGWGNTLLYIGFIAEALVFALSAFDVPVKDWHWDRVFPVLANEEEDRPLFGGGGGGGNISGVIGGGSGSVANNDSGVHSGLSGDGLGGGTIIVNGG